MSSSIANPNRKHPIVRLRRQIWFSTSSRVLGWKRDLFNAACWEIEGPKIGQEDKFIGIRVNDRPIYGVVIEENERVSTSQGKVRAKGEKVK